MKRPTFTERHVPKGRVSAGDHETGPHASVYVCDRPECIAKAAFWAESLTHQEPQYVRFGAPEVTP